MLIYGDETRIIQHGFRSWFSDKNCSNYNLDNSYILLLVHNRILARMQAIFGQQGPRLDYMRNQCGLRARNLKVMLILSAKYLSLTKHLRINCYLFVFILAL